MLRVLNFVLGLAVGILLGAAIMLLLTPQSGDEIRAGIKGKVDPYVDEGRKAFAQRKTELEDRMAQIQAGSSVG